MSNDKQNLDTTHHDGHKTQELQHSVPRLAALYYNIKFETSVWMRILAMS